MRGRFMNPISWSVGVVLVFTVMLAPVTVSEQRPDAVESPGDMAPYAHTTWVKLGELVPMEGEGTDLYVRLIAVEGEVLLPGRQ
jgi:hypothetical protein